MSNKDRWKTGKLGDVAVVVMGQSPPGDSYNSNKLGIGLINGPTEFTNKYPVIRQWTSKPTKICEPGDVLLCVRGSSTGRMNISDGNYCIGRGVASISAKQGKGVTEFIYNLLQYRVHQILAKTTGSTFPSINSDEIRKMEISVPPIVEQKKIASILSTWDKAIELKEKLIEEKKEQKKGLMQKLLTGDVRLPGFDGKWKEVKLEKVATIIMGQSPSSNSYNDSKTGIPLIQGNADIVNRKTKPSVWTTDPTKTCLIGDIIMTVRAPVGYVSRSAHDACIGRGVCAIRANNIDQDFLYYMLLNKENSWVKLSQGSTFESVNSKEIKMLNIKVPHMNEQVEIAKIFLLNDQEIDLLKKKLKQLKLQKKGLMQLLLTGKVRVEV